MYCDVSMHSSVLKLTASHYKDFDSFTHDLCTIRVKVGNQFLVPYASHRYSMIRFVSGRRICAPPLAEAAKVGVAGGVSPADRSG